MSYTLGVVTKNCVCGVGALFHHVISCRSASFASCAILRKACGFRCRISYYITVFELKYLAQPSNAITGPKIYGTVAQLSILLPKYDPQESQQRVPAHQQAPSTKVSQNIRYRIKLR
jgi:hypothetical protein